MRKQIAVWVFFIGVFSYTLYSAIRISTTYALDFSIFYYAAVGLLHHISPYTNPSLFTAFNYPLVSAILFIPLALLPFQIAQTLFTFSNVVAIFFIVFLCLRLLKKQVSLSLFLFIVSLIFLSFPTKFTLGMGQTNLLAYCFLLLGFFLFQKNKVVWTILFFVLAIFLKPILGLTLIVFLLEKKWKFFFTLSSFIFSFVILAPFLFYQPYANGIFLQNILSQSVGGREVYYNQGLLGFIARITSDFNLRKIFNVVGITFLCFITWTKARTYTIIEKLSLLLTLLVIIDPLSWQHHFVFLILPFLTTFFAIQKAKKRKILFLIVLTISYILVSWNIKYPLPLEHFPLSLLLSNQFYGAFLLFLLELSVL